MYRRPSAGATTRTAPLPVPNSGDSPDPQLTASILQAVAAQASANHTPGNAAMHATESLSGSVHVITNPASFRSFLNTNKAAVAFFTSATCGPCKMIEPLFIKLAEDKGFKSQSPSQKGAAFAKIDISFGQGQSVAAEWRIKATPTFLFFLNGSKVRNSCESCIDC
jgi:desumoylating isopeptidase 1